MPAPVLVELCAGSAAVSLRWLSPKARPPMSYQGGKRAYADRILEALGLQPGGGAADGRVVLVEAGPWGEAWSIWRSARGRREVIEYLRAWADLDPHQLWSDLHGAGVPAGTTVRVAYWTALQFFNFKSRPVLAVGGEWRTHGIHPDVNAAAYAADYVAPDGRTWKRRDRRLPDLITALEALPDLSRVEVIHGDARSVEPIPGAAVYVDPDYQGTTGYGYTLPRPDLLALAERWRSAGCVVAVSEAEALPIAGAHAHRLPAARGRGRTWSKQQAEWLTLSEPARGQLALFADPR